MLTLKVSTNQEAFDLVMRHLAEQPRAAADDQGHCLYIAPEDNLLAGGIRNRCGAGILIFEDDATVLRELRRDISGEDEVEQIHNFNGDSWSDLLDYNLVDQPDGLDSELIYRLQDLHDSVLYRRDRTTRSEFVDWDAARSTGLEFFLDTSIIDQIEAERASV